jgi:hypothetical protein
MTSWDFELVNDNRIRFDGAIILNYKYDYPREPHLFSYLELFTKGQVNINEQGQVTTEQPSSRYFETEDIKYIWENLH